jgi:aminoglycoside phosphotransferase (APT) family kinase protein
MSANPEMTTSLSDDWPFNQGELTAGLRRHTGDPSLQITNFNQFDMDHKRPGLGRLRGIQLKARGALGEHNFKLILKEPQNSARAGMVQDGIREVSVYAHLADHIPVRVPAMYAYQPDGEWFVMGALPEGRSQATWNVAEYLLAIDQLVALHDRFWGLSEFLEVYRWLRRPLKGDLDIHHQAAASGLKALSSRDALNRISEDADLLLAIEDSLKNIPELTDQLIGAPATLLHGDYWPGNIYVHKDGSLTVLDWEQASIGPGILDLVIFLQKSHWWFDPLPLSNDEIIEHYRMRMRAANNFHWPDEAWNRLWDAALEWGFVSGWVDLLAFIPDAVLDERLDPMNDLLITPYKKAVLRRQQRSGK